MPGLYSLGLLVNVSQSMSACSSQSMHPRRLSNAMVYRPGPTSSELFGKQVAAYSFREEVKTTQHAAAVCFLNTAMMICDANLCVAQQLRQKRVSAVANLQWREVLRLHNAHGDGVSASLGQTSTNGFELRLRSKDTPVHLLGCSPTDCSHGHRANNHRAT